MGAKITILLLRPIKYVDINYLNIKIMAEILMKHGDRRELAQKFDVSQVTIISALKFRTHSNVANMIRKAALEMGGVLQGAKSLKEATHESDKEDL